MSRANPLIPAVLVTPALASANNGNWQTAQRWADFMRTHYRVRLTDTWEAGDEALMIALHARRSASSIAAWRAAHPQRPLLLVLTGTDLYQDIAGDAVAQRSLQLADHLVVLNELGLRALPAPLRRRASVILQSARRWQPRRKPDGLLRALMVGHLRAVKSPETYFAAARLLAQREDIRLDHIGAPLDADLAAQAQALMRTQPRYRWLGALPHRETRERIARAHVLVHASRLEGGAHVLIEAVQSGTPVLASRIDGNLGLLGRDYAGCFASGDAQGLVRWLKRLRDEPTMLARLQAQCAARADLFEPARERQALLALLSTLCHLTPTRPARP